MFALVFGQTWDQMGQNCQYLAKRPVLGQIHPSRHHNLPSSLEIIIQKSKISNIFQNVPNFQIFQKFPLARGYCMLSTLNKLLFPIRRPYKKQRKNVCLQRSPPPLCRNPPLMDDSPHLLLLQLEADLLLQLEADLFDHSLVWSSLPLLAEGRQPKGPIHLMLHP